MVDVSNGMMTEWRTVRRGASQRRRYRHDQTSNRDSLPQKHPTNAEAVWDEEDIEQSLRGLRKSVRESNMLHQNLEVLRGMGMQDINLLAIHGLVVYGLGSLQRRQSRYQLAFLLEILSEFPAIMTRQACDPLFTATDVTVLKSHGIEVLLENDHGRRPLCHPSLVFMPHLERPCLDHFFESHVENRFLRQSLILCNSLSKILEREETSPHPKGQPLSRLLLNGALGHVCEMALIEGDLAKSAAFNDLSFHCVFSDTGR